MDVRGVASFCLLTGCWAHQSVPAAPSPTASHDERASVYANWRAGTLYTTTFVQRDTGEVTGRSTDRMTLANGTVIVHPEDLIPLTDERSEFAQLARTAGSLYSRFQAFLGTGVGLVLFGGGVLIASRINDGPVFGDDGTITYGLGLGALGVGFATAIGGGLAYSEPSRLARRVAFMSFDDALRARLRLCNTPDGTCTTQPIALARPAQARPPSPPTNMLVSPGPLPAREACADQPPPTAGGNPECVARVMRSALGLIRGCYDRSLRRDPQLAGRIVVEFSVNQRGELTAFRWREMASAPEVGECIGLVLNQLAFPRTSGGVSSFSFPFTFEPGASP